MEITTGLTAAWLDAVRRAQSDMSRRVQKQAPDTAPSYHERTLTDVIERAVKSGGAAPVAESQAPAAAQTDNRSAETSASESTRPGSRLDIRV
ncbi:hypothetical protein GJ689_16395 [Rhodoplanes serenus]|jgi:hypothetical protein|uniref:Uncharacterized protein n=1 Tax=Rhodoplanes serenus TaxID=200615 RepID=A0A327KCI0_9BRAD|nr:hypothetical protein [Rhodoplanes serenus]MTW17788.1 hypothetical protein [Rhodoplanes serenus]RAI35841.1 hypothetical protein CH340_04790 [Rhodoplanes serenus]VCU09012.1 hypothetical protein RHODGE_RHODGE_02189 [Rhodoplanes serenus]